MRSVNGRRVLITGGTGSFGSAMARRLLESGVAEVRVFSRDEVKQDIMRRALNDDRLRFYIGDVRSYTSVKRAMAGADFVFHAAALKQVPSCEFFPLEAVQTNIIGSANVIEAANEHEVAAVVCLSTDKAVYPINAMGMTKALMEKTAQAFARNNLTTRTVVSSVRYGNVMYSRGSVIPLFVEQIRAGTRLSVTDPHMTRFLMSLDEAVGLVEHAFTAATQGDLFVRKAPASTIETLALAVSELFGVEASVDVIGTRHGEKLFETLATREELSRAKDEGAYYRVPVDARDLNYGVYFDVGEQVTSFYDDYTSHNSDRLDTEAVKALLLTLPQMRRDLEIAGRSPNPAAVPA
jgi:UDP-N-acetylglucosamine 4,6-dehydratase/5-epimerase